MTTTNEMIFKTLKTKANKPAKYAEQLRGMGYEVKNTWTGCNGDEYENEYWSVDGLEFGKGDSGPVFVNLRGYRTVEKLDNIRLIDFENYLATYDERKAKAERMEAHDDIEQRHERWVKKCIVYVDSDNHEHRWWKSGCKRVERRFRHHRTIDQNHVINEYKALKRKAEARGWLNDAEDAEIRSAEEWLEYAEERVEKLCRELEQAEKDVERRKADIQKAIDKKAEGRDELNAWLVERGIREEVA